MVSREKQVWVALASLPPLGTVAQTVGPRSAFAESRELTSRNRQLTGQPCLGLRDQSDCTYRSLEICILYPLSPTDKTQSEDDQP